MRNSGPGGKRPGAGRKPGAKNRLTRELIVEAKAGGKMPLDILLRQMRDYDAQAERLARKKGADAAMVLELEDLAAERARDAAPYLHARLQSTALKVEPLDLSKFTDDELRLLFEIKQRLGGDIDRGTTH